MSDRLFSGTTGSMAAPDLAFKGSLPVQIAKTICSLKEVLVDTDKWIGGQREP